LSNQLINLHNVKSKHGQIKGNSNHKQDCGNIKRKQSLANFNISPFTNKFFIILFTIFSIVIPIGIQPQLQANFVFAQINSQSTNDTNGYSNESNISSSSTSESKAKLELINPFSSTADHDNKKVNMNIILPDIVEPNLPETQPGSIASSDQIGSDSSNDDQPNSDYKNSSNDENAGTNIAIVKGKTATAELSSSDSQIGTLKNIESKNLNVNDVNSTVSDDKPGTQSSQSQLTSQPKYKSYRDYMEKNNLSDQSSNATDDTQATGLSSMDSQMGTVNSNNSDNADKVPTVLENQTNTTQSMTTTSQSQAISQSSYKSDSTTETSNNTDISASSTSSESASSAAVSASSSNGKVYGDFNGDGKDDLAIGVPGEIDGSTASEGGGEGGVEVIYGTSGGLSATTPRTDQFWTQDSTDIEDSSEIGDNFGRSLASGDFNGDGKDDLAIGVPGEGLGSLFNVGGVEVIYGSSSGLSATSPRADQFWTQDSVDINDHIDQNDQFGQSLTTGDFNGDGKDDLAIGVPFESVGAIMSAGGVEVIYGSSSGLSATSPRADQFWMQGNSKVENSPEESDEFGLSLTSGDFNNDGRDDLAIGVPGEGIGSITNVGGVEVIYGSSGGLSTSSPLADQFWTQDTTDINDHADQNDEFGAILTSGDFNGDGRDDLAIGVPFESVGAIMSAGGVEVIYGSSAGLSAVSPQADQFWTQDSADINDHADQSDLFGTSLAAGDFNGDGRDDLAIGVRFESVGSITAAGGVEVIYGSSSGLSATIPRGDQFWTQDSTDIEDTAETGDSFGNNLASADFNGDGKGDLAIGIINEDVGSIINGGAVEVIYGSALGLSATSPLPDQFWTQDSIDINDHADQNDGFGASLA